MRGDIEEVIENPGDLVEQDPDELGAFRNLDAEQVFDREDVGVLLRERRDVIEAIEIAYALNVGSVFDQLFGAAVQEADVRIGPLDHLAVQLQDQPEHAVRRGMLRPEVHAVALEPDFGHRPIPINRPRRRLFRRPEARRRPPRG